MARIAQLLQVVATIFLLAAFGLLLVPCSTASSNPGIGLFIVRGGGTSDIFVNDSPTSDDTVTITYGLFGYCAEFNYQDPPTGEGEKICYRGATGNGYWGTEMIEYLYGYNTTDIPYDVELGFSHLSRGFVLVPLATALCGLALLFAGFRCSNIARRTAGPPSKPSRIVSGLTVALPVLALLLALPAMVVAFVAFGRVRSALATDAVSAVAISADASDAQIALVEADQADAPAVGSFAAGLWTLLVGVVALLLAASFSAAAAWRGGVERRQEAARGGAWETK